MTCPTSCHTPGCTLPYGRHLTFSIGNRHPTINRKEDQLGKDMSAYKRLRQDRLQPPHIDGSAALEARAEIPEHVAMGSTTIRPESFRKYADVFGHSALTA